MTRLASSKVSSTTGFGLLPELPYGTDGSATSPSQKEASQAFALKLFMVVLIS
jgi:hypothetical protein